MASKYGDLEKYLGAKYAQDLSAAGQMMPPYYQQDHREALYKTMDVLSILSKANLALNRLRFQRAAG